MNNLDIQLKELYQKILNQPNYKTDRTGVGTKSIFGHQMRFDMNDGFPLTTLRKIHIKSMIHELLWFLGAYDKEYKKFGNTNIRYLLQNGVSFWTEWVYEEYKRLKLKDCLDKNKKIKILNLKEFENKIIEDDYFALKYGDLGPVYGHQWTNFGGYDELVQPVIEYKTTKSNQSLIDKQEWEKIPMKGINQIEQAIDMLIETPESRRIIVTAWNPSEIDDALLPPCHVMFQFYSTILTMNERIDLCKTNVDSEKLKEYMLKNDTENLEEIKRNPLKQMKILDHFNIPERKLDLMLIQRSCDCFLGQPFNIASYSLLLHMIAQIVNMQPNEFIWTGGDTHLYSNSIGATEELLTREIRELPQIKLNKDIQNITDFRYEDIEIVGYDPHPNIKVDVAV